MIVTHGDGRTDVGRKRENNQDALLVDDELGLYAVADGMGGHAGGEVASQLALSTLADTLRAERVSVVGHEGDLPSELRALLERAMLAACAAVHQAASSGDPKTRGMGTTLTALVCLDGHAVIGHVGDSRAYLLRDGTVHQLTTDHTFANDLVRAGTITAAAAKEHPYSHVLTRALGPQPAVQVELLAIPIHDGDRFLLSSDGLSEYIPEPAWLEQALAVESVSDMLTDLIGYANEAGGRDNISVVCVEVDDSGTSPGIDNVSERFAALQAVPLFDDLPLASATRLLNCCQRQDFELDEIVFKAGEPRHGLIVVISGQFALRGDNGAFRRLVAGDYIGAATLVRPRTARRELVCIEAGQALFLWKDRLSELAARSSVLGVELYSRLAARLATQLDAVLTESSEGRDESERSPEWF